MENLIPITLNHTGKSASDRLLDWLFESQNANGFTYEYWYETEADETNIEVIKQAFEQFRDVTDWNKIETHGFKGIFFPHLGDTSSPRHHLNSETVKLIKKITPYGLISQIEHSGFQNIKIFRDNKLIFGSENQHDSGYIWLKKEQINDFEKLKIPFQICNMS